MNAVQLQVEREMLSGQRGGKGKQEMFFSAWIVRFSVELICQILPLCYCIKLLLVLGMII